MKVLLFGASELIDKNIIKFFLKGYFIYVCYNTSKPKI